MTPPRRRARHGAVAARFGAGVVAVAVVAGCVGDDDATEAGTPLEVDQGGGDLLRLRELRTASQPLRADRLCLDGPAVGAGALLECDQVPLLDVSASACRDGATLDGEDACAPPDGVPGDAVVGWIITEPSPGRRRLTVVSGSAPPPTDGEPVATLEQRYVAEDDAGVWSELAVCPRDVDGNRATDLVVLVRSADPDRIDRPEVVVVSIATGRRSGRSAPALQQAVAGRDVPRREGEGCSSPVVERLEADGDGLRIHAHRPQPT